MAVYVLIYRLVSGPVGYDSRVSQGVYPPRTDVQGMSDFHLRPNETCTLQPGTYSSGMIDYLLIK